ncbi:MAG: hypothetical protein PHN82_12265 [bacterium]|nr:hypothetical protein [bacterium]
MIRPRPSFILTAAAWAVMMALLVRHRLAEAPPHGYALLFSLLGSPGAADAWYGIYRGDARIGYAQVSLSADAAGEAVERRIDFHSVLAGPPPVTIQGDATARDPGGLVSFNLQMRAAGRMLAASAAMEEGAMRLRYDLGDYADLFVAAGVPTGGAGRGEALVPLLRPGGGEAALRPEGEEIVAAGGTLSAARRYAVETPAGELRMMIGEGAGLLRADLPGGIAVVREPRTIAERPHDGGRR